MGRHRDCRRRTHSFRGVSFFLASAQSAKTGRRALKFLLYYVLQILSSKKLENFT